MIRLISLICLVGIMAISLPVFALNGNNWADQFADGLTGKSGNAYFSGRINKRFEVGICEIKVGGFSFIEMGEPRGESRNYYVGPEVEVTF